MLEGDTLAERLALDKISRLKRQARKKWAQIEDHYDQYDCGMQMADYINTEGYTLRYELAQIWMKLAALDPEAPEAPEMIKGMIKGIIERIKNGM